MNKSERMEKIDKVLALMELKDKRAILISLAAACSKDGCGKGFYLSVNLLLMDEPFRGWIYPLRKTYR